jgi:hypothetical protein
MSRQTVFCLAASLLLAITFVYSHTKTVQGQQATPAAVTKDEEELFKDQIVMLEYRTSNDEGDSIVVSKAHVAKVGTREFVVGEGYVPKGTDDVWYADMTVGIPCEDIVRLSSMDPQRFKEYMKNAKDRSNK